MRKRAGANGIGSLDGRGRKQHAPRSEIGGGMAARKQGASGDAPEQTGPADVTIVGVGASAGGLDALEVLLGRVSRGELAVVVVQHLSPDHVSSLPEILARATGMKVVEIEDGVLVERGHVYVAPPNVDVLLRNGHLRLNRPVDRTPPRHTIDVFLRSLAAERGRRAIGVVLSGAANDGTLGLRAIKEEGGITFAQEPSTAGARSMPQSALNAGVVDFCLTPAEIGDELMRLGIHPYVALEHDLPLPADALATVFNKLRVAIGVDFAAYKRGTIERRLYRRLALLRLDTLESYVRYLDKNPSELGLLFGDLLIGVSSFFRDPDVFKALEERVLPALLEGRAAEVPLRVWVPGCATGEEAYSIAICALELLGEHAPAQPVQIFATDIDEAALDRARHAVYPKSIEAEVSTERLQRYFVVDERGYRVSRRIRDMVVFARHDLVRDPPFSRLDVISCRNVLIYLQPHAQRRVLRVFHYALNPGGALVLGLSESVSEADDLFSLADRKLKIYTKHNAHLGRAFDPGALRAAALPRERHGGPAAQRTPLSVQQVADRRLLERYAPPGMLVTDTLEVVQLRGRTGPFLEPVPGVLSNQLLKLLRPELAPVARATVAASAKSGTSASSRPVRMAVGSDARSVVIDVMPVADTGGAAPCYLVLFRDEPGGVAVEAGPPVAVEAEVEALQRELAASKESLQTTIEELEVANEELQSANEELQSSNEELQSTNEELETSKEELQSTNEELTTVNDELQSRMTQLSITGDDLKNALATVSAALLFVGEDMRIRGFSAAAEKLLNLIPSDVGRPVAYVRTVMMVRDLESVIASVIAALAPQELRVRSVEGRWYAMRVMPYRTGEGGVRGVVIELVRAPATERAAGPGEIGDVAADVLAVVPQALLVLDDKLRIMWANRAFFDLFPVGDVFGQPLERVWGGRKDAELWTLLEDTARGGGPFSDVVVEAVAPNAPPVKMSARRVDDTGGSGALTLVVIEPRAAGARG